MRRQHPPPPGRRHLPDEQDPRTVTFGAACAGCPLRERCTAAKDGRPMSIHPHEDLLRAARGEAHTEAFKPAYRAASQTLPGRASRQRRGRSSPAGACREYNVGAV